MFQISVKNKTLVQIALLIVLICILLLLDELRIDIDYVLVAFACSGVIGLIYCYPNFVIRYIMIFFMAIGNLTGVMICEHSNLWLTEMGIASFWVGSFPLLLAGYVLFIATIWMLDSRYNKDRNLGDETNVWFKLADFGISLKAIIVFFLALLAIMIFMNIAFHPAFIEHIDRFTFKNRYLTDFWERLAGWMFLGSPVLIGTILRHKKEAKLIVVSAMVALAFFCAYLVFVGEKFGGFWLLVVNLCMVFSLYGQLMEVKKLRKKIILFGKILTLLFMLLILHLSVTYSWKPSQIFENYLLQRTAQQGQLWWRTYSLDRNNDTHINELEDETRTYFQSSDKNEKDYRHAIYKIMRFTVPVNIFNQRIYQGNGSRYSTSTFSSIFYYFKRIGILIYAILAGFFFWLLVKMFLYSINHSYILEMLISTKLLGLSYGALTMSEFNLLFQVKPLLYLMLFCSLIFFRKYFNKKCRSHGRAYEP